MTTGPGAFGSRLGCFLSTTGAGLSEGGCSGVGLSEGGCTGAGLSEGGCPGAGLSKGGCACLEMVGTGEANTFAGMPPL